MEIHFLVMENSWKIIVEKEWSPWYGPDALPAAQATVSEH